MSSLAVVIVVNVLMFVGIFSRMIPFQALMSRRCPSRASAARSTRSARRSSRCRAASPRVVAGHIVTQAADGRIEHFPEVGYVVVGTTLLAIGWSGASSARSQARPPRRPQGRRRSLRPAYAAQARITGAVKWRPISVWANR